MKPIPTVVITPATMPNVANAPGTERAPRAMASTINYQEFSMACNDCPMNQGSCLGWVGGNDSFLCQKGLTL